MESPGLLLPPDQPTLTITRVFNAPRSLVWKMFSDPYHLSQWWGPHGFTNPVCELDFRVGGRWYHVMRGPDGREYPADSTFVEIVPPERIVYRNRVVENEVWEGNPPPSFVRTLTFTEADGRTTLTLFAEFDTMEHREAATRRGFVQGTLESYERLAAHVAALAG
jgi:uncharacterized protein YndB with AHSA1/START domain